MAEAHEQPQGPRPSQPDPALATVVQEGAHAPLPNHVRHGSSLAPVVTGRSSGGGLDLDRDILPRESPSQSQATVSAPTATPATPATTTTTTTGIAVAAATATIPQLLPLPPPPLPPPPPTPPSQQRPRANDDAEKAPAVRLFDELLHQQQQRQEPSAGVPAQVPPPVPASQAQAHHRRPPQGVPATDAQGGEGPTSTDGFPRNRSPARARPTSPPVAAPWTLTTAATTTITVATERPPTSAPTISVLTNGASADHARQSGFGAHSPTPKAMSNPHHQPGPPRQPIPYPSPNYAASTLSANYGWAQGGQPAEAYRTSPPTGAPSMSLPSMRTFDALQQQQHQQTQHPHQPQHPHHHMSLASPVTQMPTAMPYYPAPPMPLPGNYAAFPADTMPRYALPGDPRALIASGRHKKEIKRRTKTGCLTCRKRRIKCDEQHPVCKNCQKSRRDCMGYDPIFKQQQQHPTNIQPAPNHPAPSASVPSNGPPPPASTPLSSSSGSTYTPLPSVHSGAYMPAPVPHESLMSSHLAALEANALSSVKTESVAESASAVDPSLDSAIQTPRTSTSHSPGSHSLAPTGYDQRESDVPHLRGGGADVAAYHPSPELAPTSPYQPRSPADAGPPAVPAQGPIPALTGLPPRKMRVPELLEVTFNAVPPKPKMPLSEEQLDDVRDLFNTVYSPALQELFETKWYSKQLDRLLANEDVTALLGTFMDVVKHHVAGDPIRTRYVIGVESRVVWALACLGYSPNHVVNAGSTIPDPYDEVELRNRVAVVDALLAGDVLARNPLQHTRVQGDHKRLREIEFWWYLGEFLCIEDKPHQYSTPQREDVLHKLRFVLGGRENRDLLYSIAVIRTFGPHWPPESDNTLPAHHDEVDPRSQLAVARKYIYLALQPGDSGATTNAARRIAELGYLAYIHPGVNIRRLPTHLP